MRRDSRSEARQAVRMTDLQNFQRVCRVFLARLLMVTGQRHLTCCGEWRTNWSGWSSSG